MTEDSGRDGRAIIEALAGHMLRLIVPGFGSHRVHFVPRDATEEAAMRGNVWKTDGRNPQEYEKRVRLLRYIARQLSLPDTFVLFHIDGDRAWSERHKSENVVKFERLIRARLPAIVERGRANNPRTADTARAASAPPHELRLEHLLLICPFRSIEAWLYQNLDVAIDICCREHRRGHAEDLQAWEQRRADLDELSAPDAELCLGKAFNRELATSRFPAQKAYDVKKSFAETVERLRSCTALSQALERTRS